jgi:UDP-3-O-[3-hydroxymyristoyl] glucosamine N-acyltransferase
VPFTVQQLAELVQGRIEGDGTLAIRAARPFSDAQPGDITFVESEKYAQHLTACRASAVVAPEALAVGGLTSIRVQDPLLAFVLIAQKLHGRPEPPPCGIDPRAAVHPTAEVAPDASIHPFATVGEGAVVGARCRIYPGAAVGRFCRLGDDVTLYPNVVLYDGTLLGNRVVVHANSVLGADGFGYRQHGGRHVKVPQLGHVEVGDDVEIGACTTIDRGTFKATVIGEGTKIDNLVQVAHNCRVGRHNLFASQVGVAGSSSTGEHVILAGQVGVVDNVHVGDRTIVGAQSGVARDVPPDSREFGSPTTPEREQMRSLVMLKKLPEIYRDLRRVKEHLGLNGDH